MTSLCLYLIIVPLFLKGRLLLYTQLSPHSALNLSCQRVLRTQKHTSVVKLQLQYKSQQ